MIDMTLQRKKTKQQQQNQQQQKTQTKMWMIPSENTTQIYQAYKSGWFGEVRRMLVSRLISCTEPHC